MLRGLAVLSLLGAGAALAQAPALLPATVFCPVGAGTSVNQPGLTNEERPTTQTTQREYSQCVGVGTSVLTASSFSRRGPAPMSCEVAGLGESSSPLLTWNTGETSRLLLTANRADVQGVTVILVRTGTVVEGKFKGARVVIEDTYTNTDVTGTCLSEEGVTRINTLSTLTLTNL